MCNEFGFFQTATRKTSHYIGSIPLDYYIGMCQRVYGNRHNQSTIRQTVDGTNARFGGVRAFNVSGSVGK